MNRLGLVGFFLWSLGCFLTIEAVKLETGSIDRSSLYHTFGFGVLFVAVLPLIPLAVAFKHKIVGLILSILLLCVVLFILVLRVLIGSYDNKTGELFFFRDLDVMVYEYAWPLLLFGVSMVAYGIWRKN